MSCKPWLDPACVVAAPVKGLTGAAGEAVGQVTDKAVAAAVGGIVEEWAQACRDAASWAMHNLLTVWVNAPDPDVAGADSPVAWLSGRLTSVVTVLMLVSVLVGAFRLAVTRKWDHAADTGQALARTVAVAAGGVFVIAALVKAADAYTEWIIAEGELSAVSGKVMLAGISQPVIVIVLGLIVALTQIVQVGLMMVRNAMIVLLAAVLPAAAATSNTATGRQWWSKSFAWLLAFIVYQPAAAIIYATGFTMVGDQQDAATVIEGVFLLALAVFTLPALMRFLVPATQAMAGGNAGGFAGAAVGGAVATGAALAPGALASARGALTALAPLAPRTPPAGPSGAPPSTGGGPGSWPGGSGGRSGGPSGSHGPSGSRGGQGRAAAAGFATGAAVAGRAARSGERRVEHGGGEQS